MKAFALRLAFGVLLAACLGTCYGQSESAAIRQGFAAPPAGYGEVPFWWWTGEKLDVDRLLWQLDELKKNAKEYRFSYKAPYGKEKIRSLYFVVIPPRKAALQTARPQVQD